MNTEKIWFRFKDELHRFILSRTRNASAAEDILQEVFMRIHQNLKSLRSEDRLSSWLYQITRNVITDYYRKEKQLKNIPPVDADDAAAYLHFEKCIHGFVDELPPKYREALVKTELGSLSQKDFAAEIGISYSGAKSRVQRAKEELKDLFVTCCAEKITSTGQIEFKDPEDCTC